MLSTLFGLSEAILHNLPADFETREEIYIPVLPLILVQSPWQCMLETSREVTNSEKGYIGLLSNFCGMVGGVKGTMSAGEHGR